MKMKIMMAMGLAAVLGAGAVWFAAPQQANAAETETNSASKKILYYTCPMHSSVRTDKPGDCPICGMHLMPVYAPDNGTNAPAANANTNPPAAMPGCSMGGCGH